MTAERLATRSCHTGLPFVCFFLLTLLGALAPASVQANEQTPRRKIAILEFEAINDEARASNKGRIVSEKITTVAVKSDLFDVVERQLIQRILDENEFGKDGFSGTTAQKIGQLVGADAVLSGSVTEYKDELSIDARLVDVGSGRILMADEAYARNDLQSITNAAKTVYRKMVGTLQPASPLPAPATVTPEREAEATSFPGQDQSPAWAGVMRYPEASQRLLSEDELRRLDKAELRFMRNEVYARHGYIFQSRDLSNHFSRQAWYRPISRNIDHLLSAIEQHNVLLIKRIEDQKR